MLVFIHPCNLVGEMPQTPERFQRNRLRSCGAEHHSILKSESRIVRFTAFMQIRFFLISVDRHFAKVSAHILYPKLRHPRLYQAEFSFIYEKFDLYRSFAIPVVWHYSTSLRISIPFISSESLWKSQTVFISSSVQPISSLISESLFSRSTVQMIALTLTEDREPFQTSMPSPSIDVVFSI